MTTSPTPCRCGPDGCADSSCPGRRTLSPADALDAMRHQLDPVDDWREPLERAAAELRRLAAVERERNDYLQRLNNLHVNAQKCRADRDRLAAEVESLRADAERYRWLRDAENGGAFSVGQHCSVCDEYPKYEEVAWYYGLELDGLIDAAIDAAKKEGK